MTSSSSKETIEFRELAFWVFSRFMRRWYCGDQQNALAYLEDRIPSIHSSEERSRMEESLITHKRVLDAKYIPPPDRLYEGLFVIQLKLTEQRRANSPNLNTEYLWWGEYLTAHSQFGELAFSNGICYLTEAYALRRE